jgi:hypothetical protein
MERLTLSVAKQFSTTPGPRKEEEGEYSGENFLNNLLLPNFKLALQSSSVLTVDLDGTAGYATSFLEAAFGGLARIYDPQTVIKHIDFKSNDEPYLIDEIKSYIAEAQEK